MINLGYIDMLQMLNKIILYYTQDIIFPENRKACYR